MAAEAISRRSALGASLSGLMAAGLAATTPPPVAEAAAPLVTVVHADDLAAECRQRHADVLASLSAACDAEGEVAALISKELMNRVSVTVGDSYQIYLEWVIAELARHLPGVAPIIRQLEHHISTVAY